MTTSKHVITEPEQIIFLKGHASSVNTTFTFTGRTEGTVTIEVLPIDADILQEFENNVVDLATNRVLILKDCPLVQAKIISTGSGDLTVKVRHWGNSIGG